MADQKALVVYYSRTGNTRKIAGHIAEELGARLEQVVDINARPGIWGFFRAGMPAARGSLTFRNCNTVRATMIWLLWEHPCGPGP